MPAPLQSVSHRVCRRALGSVLHEGQLCLQGAHLTAWLPPGERPVLFTSPNSVFAPGRAIRGGLPIIFPWFGASRQSPAAPQHGFARTTTWHLDSVETVGGQSLTLTLSLGDGDVGSPAMNFLPVHVQDGANGGLAVRVTDQIVLPVPPARVDWRRTTGR